MDDVLRKYEIQPLHFPVEKHLFTVKVFLSRDDEEYFYCGIMNFCDTMDECFEFIRKYEEEHK